MIGDFISAMQFLTRIPMPSRPYAPDSLARAVKFFPLAGFVVGAAAAFLHILIAPHLPRLAAAFVVLVFLVAITGGLHEDGLADTADAFGGGSTRDKILLILRDSRIGSYGGIALALSLLGRLVLIASLPLAQVTYYLIAAHVRWTVLPLSHFLASQRSDGQGVRIARLTSRDALIGSTIFSFALAIALLRVQAIAPILSAIAIAWLTGMYYKRRIGGITGDCFGATIQLAEIGVYLCGAWTP